MLETPTPAQTPPNKETDLDRAQRNEIAPWRDPVTEDLHVAVFQDRYPVTPGHLLFVPKWDTDYGVWYAFRSARETGEHLRRNGEIDGYNIGLNQGVAAGQTVLYPHVHLIPRMSNDCADPTGGVRAVIPGQANYRAATYRQP